MKKVSTKNVIAFSPSLKNTFTTLFKTSVGNVSLSDSGNTILLANNDAKNSFMKKILLLSIAVFALFANSFAQLKTANAGAVNWNTAASWTPAAVPTATDSVVIPSGSTVTANTGTMLAAALNVKSGGTLTFQSSASREIRVAVGGSYFGTVTIDGALTYQNSNGQFISWNGSTFTIGSGATITLAGASADNGGIRFTGTGTSVLTTNGKTIGPIEITGTGTLTQGDNVTLSAARAANTLLRLTSGNYTVPSGLTLTLGGATANVPFNIAASKTLSVLGTFNTNKTTAGVNSGTISIGATGTYQHNMNGGAIPTCTWVSGSTCEITGNTATSPTGLGQTFSNFTWNSAAQNTTTNLTGNLTTINGNFSVLNTGTASNGLRLTNATATLTVGGNLTISSGSAAKLDLNGSAGTSTVNVAGDVTIGASGTLLCNSAAGVVKVGGNWSSSGTLTPANTTVEFNGTGAQSITKTGGETFNNFTLNKASGDLTFINQVTVGATLTLTAGKVLLGANNFVLNGTTAIAGAGLGAFGATSTSYIVTNGAGGFRQYVGPAARTGNVIFPIGISTSSYTPVQLTNTGTVDSFTVSVATGTPTGVTGANSVDRNWTITEKTGGGSVSTVALQWPAAAENGSFVTSNCAVVRTTSGSISSSPVYAASSGSDPYTKTSEASIASFTDSWAVTSQVLVTPDIAITPNSPSAGTITGPSTSNILFGT